MLDAWKRYFRATGLILNSEFQRVLALIYLAHASDVLENAFAPLSDEDYDVAMKRVRFLLGKLDPKDPI